MTQDARARGPALYVALASIFFVLGAVLTFAKAPGPYALASAIVIYLFLKWPFDGRREKFGEQKPLSPALSRAFRFGNWLAAILLFLEVAAIFWRR